MKSNSINIDQVKILLNDILKKSLDKRLNKLEKKNKEEDYTLNLINKESQKSILVLEEYSHKVRKHIYLLKNKYVDERRTIQNSLKDENINNNNIDLKTVRQNIAYNLNTNINILNTIGNVINLKKPEISQHEKEEKLKIKKKRNTTFSPKAKKNMLLEEKMKSIQKSIKDLKDKFKSTKNIKKSHKNFYSYNTSPKKAKNKILYSNSKKSSLIKSPNKFTKTLNTFRITVNHSKKFEKKWSENETKINNNIHELSTNGIEKDEDIRLSKLKLENDKNEEINNIIVSKKSLITQFNEIVKTPIIENPSIIKEDSLLVEKPGSLSNEIIFNNEKKLNSNNNINNKIESKEINNNITNISNINLDINNISEINLSKNNIIFDDKINKEKESDEIKLNNDNFDNRYSKNNINNIILSNNNKNITDYLVGDGPINFTLIEPDTKNNPNDENSKTMDLNISGLSDQLTLEEKFQTQLDNVLRYLDKNDICILLLVNKECFKTIMNFFISKIEIKMDIFEEEIQKIKKENKNYINLDLNNLEINKFEFNANSSRAISLLNTISLQNFLTIKNLFFTNKEINLIFDIFFIAEGSNDITSIDNIEKKWEYIFDFFKEHIMKQSLGTFIESKLNGKIFNDKIINLIYKYSYKHLNIINPNHFQNINKDIAILLFIIKDMLEHLGISLDSKFNPEKEIILLNSRLRYNKIILEKLNEMNNKII